MNYIKENEDCYKTYVCNHTVILESKEEKLMSGIEIIKLYDEAPEKFKCDFLYVDFNRWIEAHFDMFRNLNEIPKTNKLTKIEIDGFCATSNPCQHYLTFYYGNDLTKTRKMNGNEIKKIIRNNPLSIDRFWHNVGHFGLF